MSNHDSTSKVPNFSLSFNRLDTELQKLRCRVNYHALKLTDPILEMGRKLVERIRKKSKHFLLLNLRFEPDMLTFSGCYYGGGEKERQEIQIKKEGMENGHQVQRKLALCLEHLVLVMMFIFVSHLEKSIGVRKHWLLSKVSFQIFIRKTLASNEELAPFSSFSSWMAALDFIICDESDVFVSNNNGNMARILAGRRRYFGHKPTVLPNAKKLLKLFTNRNNMAWEEFASHFQTYQIGFMGEPMEVKPGRGEFHENPSACNCEDSNGNARENVTLKYPALNFEMSADSADDGARRSFDEVTEGRFSEEEQDWFDTDLYGE